MDRCVFRSGVVVCVWFSYQLLWVCCQISATAFTVTEVVNKFLTVVINVLIWDKHASPVGLVCLLVTICGGIGYQQSVTVAKKPTSGPAQVLNDSEKVDEESVELIPGKVATNV